MRGYKVTTEEFIERAKSVHGNRYDYTETVYITGKEKVKIYCEKHGDFYQSPVSHLSGSGCKKCAFERISEHHSSSQEDFLKRSKEAHGNKYDYSKAVYTGIRNKVIIICPKNHEFEQEPGDHYKGRGCPYCVGQKVTDENRLSLHYPEVAAEWDYEKNEDTPDDVSVCSHRRRWWICGKCKKSYSALVYYKTRNDQGCPECIMFKGPKRIKRTLKRLKIEYDTEYTIDECKDKGLLPFDFAILIDGKMVGLIEYQGYQHYFPHPSWHKNNDKFENLQRRDKIKAEFCQENQIPLLIIPYTEYNNIETLVEDFLCKTNQKSIVFTHMCLKNN